MKLDTLEIQSLKEVTRNPWLYISSLLTALWSFTMLTSVTGALATTFFAVLLITLTLIDFKHMILPDLITIPAIPLGLVIAPLFLNIHWIDSLLGAALGYGFFFIIAISFKKLKGKDGMGFGDIKLLSMLGAWCGAFALPLIVLGSSIIGITFFLLRKVHKGTSTSTPMPYGPFLAVSGWLALLYGHSLWITIFQWRTNLTVFILGE